MENTVTITTNNNHNVANSRDSSPQSRDADLTNPFDEQTPPPPPIAVAATATYKVKFMCSYGGRIQPRPHDNQLSYVGGDTKILAVDRNIRFAALTAKLSTLTGGGAEFCFKYQLPGEDLDALISVTNDEDLDHMMVEYDRLCRSSPRPARLRLIIFPLPYHNNNNASSLPPLPPPPSVLTKPEPQWFVDALNSVKLPEPSIPPSHSPPPSQLPPQVAALNPDFLFGLDNPYPFASTIPDFAAGGSDLGHEAVTETEFVRFNLGSNDQHQQQKSDEDNARVNGNGVEIYSQRTAENAVHSVSQVQSGLACVSGPVPVQVPKPGSLLHNSHRVSGTGMEQVPVYFIQTPSGIYQAVRPMNGPLGAPVYLIQAPASVSLPAQKVAYGGSEVPYAVPQQAAAVPGGDAWN